jgi:hypothetical protein
MLLFKTATAFNIKILNVVYILREKKSSDFSLSSLEFPRNPFAPENNLATCVESFIELLYLGFLG